MIFCRIQTHPDRLLLANALADSIDLKTQISLHSSEPPSPWAGYRAALQFLPPDASHLLVIQDDATICANFTPAVTLIADANPDRVVCLFVPGSARWLKKQYLEAVLAKRRYIEVPPSSFMPVVAVLWPKHKAEEFFEWSETAKISGIRSPWRSDDAVAGAWMRLTRQSVRATVPSIVEHLDNVPCVKGKAHQPRFGKDKGRIAMHYIGDRDPLEIDWGHSAI